MDICAWNVPKPRSIECQALKPRRIGDKIDMKGLRKSTQIANKINIIRQLEKVHDKFTNKDFIKTLKGTDFFTAPCSKAHHLSTEGGLAQHSWNVFKLLKEKNERYDLGLSEESVIICGLLHDICKVHFYKPDGDGYAYNDQMPLGHGEKSVIILAANMELTQQECCMIRWHMGNWDLSSYGRPAYNAAMKMYPNCEALQTADYEASVFLE